MRKQFFTFWTERPDRCQRLFDELTKLLAEYYPESIQCQVDREINAIKNDNKQKCAEQIEQYQQTLANIEESRNVLKEAEANEPARQKDMQQKRNYVRKRIKEKGAEAVETDWKDYLEHQRELVSPETQSRERIEEIIKKLEVLQNFFADIPWTIQGEG